MRGCRALTKEETKRLLDAPAGHNAHRDRAILAIGIYTGLRVSEIISITRAQLADHDVIYPTLRIPPRACKGGHQGRDIPLTHPRLLALLQPWVTNLAALHPTGTAYLARSSTPPHGPITRVQAWRIIRGHLRTARITGPPGSLGSHTLRKTFAARAWEATGHDLLLTQTMLGHRRTDSTRSYLSLDEAALNDAYRSI